MLLDPLKHEKIKRRDRADTTFKEGRKQFSGCEGSQAVTARPSGKGTLKRRKNIWKWRW
jgi:hypothetical protein